MSDFQKKSDNLMDKLSAARTRLIMERPFLGALTLRLPLEEGDASWCKTTATDAKKIYFNANYVANISLGQLQFMLAHNALHCALGHFNRKQNRNQHRWDIACDFAINAMLVQDGLQMPIDALYFDKYCDMSAEEIYPLIKENPDQEPIDQHIYDDSNSDSDNSPDKNNQGNSEDKKPDGSNGNKPKRSANKSDKETENEITASPKPQPLTHNEKEDLEVKWQQSLAGAAQLASQAGKISPSMLKMVDFLLQPKVSWRALLALYLTSNSRDDYSFSRPSRRSHGGVIYPSLYSKQINLVVVIDSSGSISDLESQEFVNEVSILKSQVNARVTLIVCDQEIIETPQLFEPWEEITDLSHLVKAGRGTSFIPPFEWVAAEGINPDLLIYFTDADSNNFPPEPSYPVLWLIKGKNTPMFGIKIQFN